MELNDLLKQFRSNNLTYKQFYSKAKVRVNENLFELGSYKNRKNLSEENIMILYKIIEDKQTYLTNFYETSLKMKTGVGYMNEETPMKKGELSNNQKINYKNVIRNLHFEDILGNTSSGFNNIPSYLTVVRELFNDYIIDYKLLTKSALEFIKNGRFGSVLSSFYFRASIMNPYLVYSINESMLQGKKIFTPTLGWSSYAYGFLESPGVEEYVGTDVIPDVCKKTKELCSQYNKVKTTIYCKPSEKLLELKSFRNKYENYFDVVFFSPPYFKLEQYKSDHQSTENYTTYDEWLEKYWEPTMKLCNFVLKEKGKLCYIISDYGSQNTGQLYELVNDTKKYARKYFDSFKVQSLLNKNVHVTKHRDTDEKIIICKKK
jgi:hypothetical protein|uniref:DNA methylase N-4/N-6 domain-containing protein n=1 Tax=viral metagenome TaxID=1070528 RepID=A0A6C0IM84_9ZZZZ